MTYIWRPNQEYSENANVVRLMRHFGVADADALRAVSVADVGAFWDAVVTDLGIRFRRPYRRVLDTASGPQFPEWFVGGELNVADACLGRWAEQSPAAPAVVRETEAGLVRQLPYAELADQVARVRGGLRRNLIGPGDAVALYLPMIPEAVVALYAVASLGAIAVPLFSGFAPGAIAARLRDAEVKAVITADGTVRRGRTVRMRPQLDEAIAAFPGVRLVVTVENLAGAAVGPTDNPPADEAGEPAVVRWSSLLAGPPDPDIAPTAASDVLLLGYTSGTTGRPKGAVHTHAGFLTKVASELAYGFELGPGRSLCWITDMGWIMGPLTVLGTHACGGSLVLYEGSPDTPDSTRVWQLVARHRVTTLGVSPTLVRTLRAACPRRTSRRSGCWAPPASHGTRSPTSGWPATSSPRGCRS
nr:AMP-binding protein [Candidatus Frankia alpina]